VWLSSSSGVPVVPEAPPWLIPDWMVWAIIVSKHKSKSMRNIDWCSSRNYTSLNLTFIVHGEKHNFREENHSICSCCCPVAPVSRSLALQALRWMGAFGGWSLKRELGYGNLRLAQGITYYTCSFWKPKRSVIYIYINIQLAFCRGLICTCSRSP
jgi:hypothetical protein